MEKEMNLNLRVIICTTIFLLPVVSMADDTVPLPSTSDGLYSRVPQMEKGKVKRISKDKLPADLRAVTEKDIEKSQLEYEEVPEMLFSYTSSYHNNLRTGPDATSNVLVQLADVSTTLLDKYQYEGLIPAGPTLKGPWTSVTRVFRRPDGLVIKLTEWDFVADGGAIVIVDELMNSSVSGIPAYFSAKKSPSGRAITTVEWATDKKQYTLTAEDNDKIRGDRRLSDQKWLLKIANSIARSDGN
jgi:hypothetical protein